MARNDSSIGNFFGFLAGLTSLLFVSTPFGRVSMLDFSTYFIGPVFFLMDFGRYSKAVKSVLIFAVIWLLGGVWSDFYRATPFKEAMKANAIIFNAFTILVVAYHVLERSPKAMVYFLIGNAISGVVSLYVFQNGGLLGQAVKAGFEGGGNMQEFLVSKMRYPFYINLALYGVLMWFRIKGLIPWFLCVGAFFASGVYVLTQAGGRSAFLVSAGTAGLMAIYAYRPELLPKIFKNKIRIVILTVVMASMASFSYYHLAERGILGEEARAKAAQKKAGGSALETRIDLIANWPFLWRSPLTGCGATFQDKWSYLDKNDWIEHDDPITGKFVHRGYFYGHSCLVGYWTQTGIWGMFFWMMAIFLVLKSMGNHVFVLGDFAPFFMGTCVSIIWNILFSPYGMFRGYCMFTIMFAALLANRRYLDLAVRSFCSPRQRALMRV